MTGAISSVEMKLIYVSWYACILCIPLFIWLIPAYFWEETIAYLYFFSLLIQLKLVFTKKNHNLKIG